jgi:hypothetical protein
LINWNQTVEALPLAALVAAAFRLQEKLLPGAITQQAPKAVTRLLSEAEVPKAVIQLLSEAEVQPAPEEALPSL